MQQVSEIRAVMEHSASSPAGEGRHRRAGSLRLLVNAGLAALFTFSLGCHDLVYLLPQDNAKHSIDIEVTDASGTTLVELSLEDREGYFGGGNNGSMIFAWPSFDEYGYVPEQVCINFYPNFEGVQALAGGQIITPDGTWDLTGQLVDFEVSWENSRKFPFEHHGTFVGEPVNGLTITGEFTLANSNCLNGTLFTEDSYDSCGAGFLAAEQGDYELSWSPNPQYQFCPQAVVDAFLGSDYSGSVERGELNFGEMSLDCVDSYNARHMCGQDPVELEVDGCTWEVVGRGGGSGYDASVAFGWFVMSATTQCDMATVNVCDSWFYGTQAQ